MFALILHHTRTVIWLGASLAFVLILILLSPQLLPTQLGGNPTMTPLAIVSASHTPVLNVTTAPSNTSTKPVSTAVYFPTVDSAALPKITSTSMLTLTPPPLTHPSLSTFPSSPGTTWVYIKNGYSQADGDPQKIIRGTSKIMEQIVDRKTYPPYTLVHIKGNKEIVSADDGWQENGSFGIGDYEYWYILVENQLYYSFAKPDPAQIKIDEMRLDYQFPLVQGSEWYVSTFRRGTIENTIRDQMRRVVVAIGPYHTPLGELGSCFEIHDVANSGDVITWYCEEIGIAAVKYDHGGSLFGTSQELISFSPGTDISSPR